MGDAYVKWFRTQEYYDSGAWRGTWALDGGGALMNQAIHSVDLLLWFMGPVVEVSAYTATLAHERIEVEDVAVATIKFANGALGVIEASTATLPGELKRIEISGDAGSAIAARGRPRRLEIRQGDQSRRSDPREDGRPHAHRRRGGDPKAIGHHGHMLQFQDVLNAIKKGKKPLVDGPEGRKADRADPGHLQIGRNRQAGQAAAGGRSAAQGPGEGEKALSQRVSRNPACRRNQPRLSFV